MNIFSNTYGLRMVGRGSSVAKALRYKSEGRWFESQLV